VEKVEENIKKNGKENVNGTPKSISMGCYWKEAQNWKEVLERKLEFEFVYYIYHFMYVSILFHLYTWNIFNIIQLCLK
jgi:hypothetical protein